MRLAVYGPNALQVRRVTALGVLASQVRNPLLLLLVAAAAVSGLTGDPTDASIIAAIVALSVGLGFFNEYRAAKAVADLHRSIHHETVVWRDGDADHDRRDEPRAGRPRRTAGRRRRPGRPPARGRDRARVRRGGADGRVAPGREVRRLDGRWATPRSTFPAARSWGPSSTRVPPAASSSRPVPPRRSGRSRSGLGERQADTAFQVGLRGFSALLVKVAGVLTVSIFVINIALSRPLIESLLFSLAIAIGITPQLLPAIVSVSLSTGSRALARKRVLVKRLVTIEDLGNIEVLFTDKTGTLTEGAITFHESLDALGAASSDVLLLGLECNEATMTDTGPVGGNSLDLALLAAPAAAAAAHRNRRRGRARAPRPAAVRPRSPARVRRDPHARRHDDADHQGRARGGHGALRRHPGREPGRARRPVRRRRAGRGSGDAGRARDSSQPAAADERDLRLAGFLSFVDRPKADAGAAIAQAEPPRCRREDHHRRQRHRRGQGLPRHRTRRRGRPQRRGDRGARRRRPRSGDPDDDDLRAGRSRSEVAAHQGGAPYRRRRRVPRRRRQRRGGAARRRRRDLGRLRDRCREGRGRHRPARQGPRRARRRRHGGAPDLRQHAQVRADGHVVELREHVQRGRRDAVPPVPADAALADPAEQPALRRRPDGDPDGPRRPRGPRAAGGLGHRVRPPLHGRASARSARSSTSRRSSSCS